MSEEAKPSTPVRASEVIEIVGPLDDAVVAGVVATGATPAEVLEAYTWLTADDQLGTELDRTRTGKVAQVYDILAPEFEGAEEG